MTDAPTLVRLTAVVALGALASVGDLRTRRIPNVLTFGAAALGIAFQALTGGLPGAGLGLVGWLAGAALFFPFFALGGMGAGDVKLLAAFGAWLGPAGALWTALYGALAGGALAMIVAVRHRYATTALSNVWWLLGYWKVAGVRPLPELTLEHARGPRLPYALPIAIGAMVTLWFR